VLDGDLLDEVRRLKAAPGGDVCLTGSISVTHRVLAAGVVDELRLFTYPVVLGRGRRLFPDGARLDGLRAGPVTSFRGGVVLLTYSTA
jgi:dihydrofolate reductase